MSRQPSASSALQAAAAAVLVIGVLLLLVVSGDRSAEEPGSGSGDSASAGPAAGVQDVSGLELPGGFDPIPADEFFTTVTGAQKAAGTWTVVSTAESGGEASAPANQDVQVTASGVDVRISMQGSFGPVEALWVDETFFVKGLTPPGKPWLKPDGEGQVGELLAGLVAYSDPEQFLGAIREPAGFQLVGVEDTDAGRAAHYRIRIDAQSFLGDERATAEDSIEMDMWVDEQDRPVQVVTVSDVGGSQLRSTLIYSDYGQELELTAPPARQVTTTLPPGLAG